MDYAQSITNIEAAQATFYATNTDEALRLYEAARKTHKELFGHLSFVRGVWA